MGAAVNPKNKEGQSVFNLLGERKQNVLIQELSAIVAERAVVVDDPVLSSDTAVSTRSLHH